MEVKRICAAYWSATGNTDKTVNTIAETLAEKLGVPLERRNFTRPSDRAEDLSFTGGDLVVFGMPTYAGKLPNKMLPYVQQQIHGNGALAVGVVTFGNRSYDNSLAELCAALEAEWVLATGMRFFFASPTAEMTILWETVLVKRISRSGTPILRFSDPFSLQNTLALQP